MPLTPQDELAYEANYREADPLGLDGDPMRDPAMLAEPSAAEIEAMGREAREHAFAEVSRKLAFYQQAIKQPRYTYFVEKNDRGYGAAIKAAFGQIEAAVAAGDLDAAEAGVTTMEEEFSGLEDRISDLASD